jgi:hypothetical protein
MPEGHYDYLSTLPDGTPQVAQNLQAELKQRFGFVAHFETRDTDVLLLQIKDADKLKGHLTKGGRSWVADGTGANQVHYRSFTNQPVDALSSDLEVLWQKPVVDRTGSQVGPGRRGRGRAALGTQVSGLGSQDRYDFYVEWNEQRWPSKAARRKSLQQIWAAALDNFGLELVPSRESQPMWVVERVKN